MGLFKKYDELKQQALQKVRDVQGQVNQATGSAMRSATGQDGPLPSNAEGPDVLSMFGPAHAHENGFGEGFVQRHEDIDGCGWELFQNRLGTLVSDHQTGTQDRRLIIEALNRPVRTLVDWEALKVVYGFPNDHDDIRYNAGEEIRLLMRAEAERHEGLMLFQHVVIHVVITGQDIPSNDLEHWLVAAHTKLDRPALVEWQTALGLASGEAAAVMPGMAGRGLGSERAAQERAASAGEPELPGYPWPTSYEVDKAVEAAVAGDAPARRFFDYDGLGDISALVGWTEATRTVVVAPGFEGLLITGADPTQRAELICLVDDELSPHPERTLTNFVQDQVELDPPFPGTRLFTGGTCYDGYPAVASCVGDCVAFTRVNGADLAAAHRLASAAMEAMPE